VIPVPDTVSPELKKLLAQPPFQWPEPPKTTEAWKAFWRPFEHSALKALAKMSDSFGVSITPTIVGGVRCCVVTPKVILPKNKHRLLVDLHHGGFFASKAGLDEAIIMAGLMGYKVLEVDYRGLPDDPFPAAMDDAMAVWKEVIRSTKPRNIGLVGGSAGGGLVLSLVQRLKREGLPLPGAVMSATPWCDLSKSGDSWYTMKGSTVCSPAMKDSGKPWRSSTPTIGI
jgi:acetyl esterase/lipase